MNKIRNTPEDEGRKASKAPRKQSAFVAMLLTVIDGSFLNAAGKRSNLPFGLFIALIIGFYIANTYNAERTIRETDRIGIQLKDYRDEYISLKSELMFRSNQSQVAVQVAPLGLLEAKEPPHKLIIENSDSTQTND